MDDMNNRCGQQEMRTEIFGTPAIKLTQALKRAEKFTKGKKMRQAHRERIRCVALTRIIYGKGHWRLAQALANLAHSYLMLLGFPVQAVQHANSAKGTILIGGRPPQVPAEEMKQILSTLLTIYYTLGVAHWMQKNGKESLFNLEKAECVMKELQQTELEETTEQKISEEDLAAALGRACLLQNKPLMATRHFEKAISAVISARGEMAPELIDLYQETAHIEQVKKNHKKSIEYLLQAHCVVLTVHTKFSPQAASAALLLGKAYAASGEQKDAEMAEMYFNESLLACKAALGSGHSQTINALEEFSKWLVHMGKREQAYDLLQESFMSQPDLCSDFSEKAAERFYIMGGICLAEQKVKEGYQWLSKALDASNQGFCFQIREEVGRAFLDHTHKSHVIRGCTMERNGSRIQIEFKKLDESDFISSYRN
ncbi:tetratricopeptide repeat protein 23-like isoform X2 [Eublepharis macularius]|uniref:Tetratricopeptide repeat protein 23-like isoform X2 n=1 Tax=Eublepharis macularius TaxID=481883 RepID=A0AA97JRH1_EUBMA|nr:tetratricopeptide repeat protein 23-like isoform X2 [Eublepharis macularius]